MTEVRTAPPVISGDGRETGTSYTGAICIVLVCVYENCVRGWRGSVRNDQEEIYSTGTVRVSNVAQQTESRVAVFVVVVLARHHHHHHHQSRFR